MVKLNDYLGKCLVNKRVRFKCDCTLKFDISGLVTSYELASNEIIWHVENNGKHMHIGSNTPKLYIEIL